MSEPRCPYPDGTPIWIAGPREVEGPYPAETVGGYKQHLTPEEAQRTWDQNNTPPHVWQRLLELEAAALTPPDEPLTAARARVMLADARLVESRRFPGLWPHEPSGIKISAGDGPDRKVWIGDVEITTESQLRALLHGLGCPAPPPAIGEPT